MGVAPRPLPLPPSCLFFQAQDIAEVSGTLSAQLPGYRIHWACSEEKKGYSGVCVMTKLKPAKVSVGFSYTERDEETGEAKRAGVRDTEGRVVALEFDRFHLVNGKEEQGGVGSSAAIVRLGMGGSAASGRGSTLEARRPLPLWAAVYTPNSGEGLKRLGFRIQSWDKSFGEYIKELVSRPW